MTDRPILVFPLLIGLILLAIGCVLIITSYYTHDVTQLAGSAVAVLGSHTPLNRSGIYERIYVFMASHTVYREVWLYGNA